MLAVSPSPLMPIDTSLRLAKAAPVATEGIRPCSALKPWLYWRKYAGVLLEQPIPLNFTVEYGLIPTDLHASIRWLVMLLWPHPLQSVEGSPWNARVGRVRVWPLFWIWMVASLAMTQSPLPRGWVEGRSVRVRGGFGPPRVRPGGVDGPSVDATLDTDRERSARLADPTWFFPGGGRTYSEDSSGLWGTFGLS